MHEPNLFQGTTLVLLAALTASAPTQMPYTRAETRLASMNALDPWPELEKHRSLIAHVSKQAQPMTSFPHLDVNPAKHPHALHHQGGHLS